MTNGTLPSPLHNALLDALRVEEHARLLPCLETVDLAVGQRVFEVGDLIDQVFFPTSSRIALLAGGADGHTVQLTVAGRGGLVGLPVLFAQNRMEHAAVVQTAGQAFRLRAELLSWELAQNGNLKQLLLGYAGRLFMDISHATLCSRYHSTEQRFCGWLLASLQAAPESHVHGTQAFIAGFLGVRREGVTETASRLQADGVISYSRGDIRVLDIGKLEARACTCFHSTAESASNQTASTPVPATRRMSPVVVRKLAEIEASRLRIPTETGISEMGRNLHELQVQKIELTMINQSLDEAYHEADRLRALYTDIYNFSPVAFATLDRQGVIIQINLAGAILLGIKRSEMGRHRFSRFVEDVFTPNFAGFLTAVIQGHHRESIEIALAANDRRGSAIVRLDAIADEGGNECRLVVTDITAQRRSEQALQLREQSLRESEEQFRTLATLAPVAIFITDREGGFSYVNPLWCEMAGLSPAESAGDGWQDAIHPADRAKVAVAWQDAMKAASDWEMEFRLRTPGERTHWVYALSKPVRDSNGAVIRHIGISMDITERHEGEEVIRQWAFFDPLTRLANRRLLMDRLDQAMMSSNRSGVYGALMLVDLDEFKPLNDTHGHAVGDMLLREAALRLKACVREMDTVARLGGDEFVVMLSELSPDPADSAEQAKSIADKVVAALAAPYEFPVEHEGGPTEHIRHRCTASVGVVLFINHQASAMELLRLADEGMYKAKAQGRNTAVISG